MAATTERSYPAARRDFFDTTPSGGTPDRAGSAVSWASIIGGALAAAAVSFILLELGAGLGMAVVSPWPSSGASATSFTIGAGIWLIVIQWIAAGIGGYLAGRLRTKWVGLHTDEVFFRDTAHGFLSWAVASVIGALLAALLAFAAIGGTARAVGQVASGAAQGVGPNATQQAGATSGSAAYFVDSLFRSNSAAGTPDASGRDPRAEAGRILTTDLRRGDLSADDRAYLTQLVAERTGLSPADAGTRVDNVVAQLKAAEVRATQAADAARKSAASAAIITALALLIGAFIASTAGAMGGRRRDQY